MSASKPSNPEALTNCQLLAQWAGLSPDIPSSPAVASGSPTAKASAPAPALLSPIACMLKWAKAAPSDHYRGVANCDHADWKAALATLRFNGEELGLAERGTVILFHSTARRLCGLDPWPDDPATPAVTPPPVASPLTASMSSLGGAHGVKALNLPTISLRQVLDQKANEEIVYLSAAALQAMLATYHKVMDELPPPDVAPCSEQLAAIDFVLRTERAPYADFGVWVKNGLRAVRRSQFTGLTLQNNGQFQNIEIYGPPNIDDWCESYDVLAAALIMTGAVRRPKLAAYRSLILNLHKRYGPSCWALLYQTDVRCRSERMDALKFELSLKHENNVALGIVSSFNPALPWNDVWDAVIADGEYWRVHFEVPAGFIRFGSGTSSASVIDGDAPIAHSRQPQQPRQDPKKPGRGNQPQQPPAPQQPDARELCEKFNRGKCGAALQGNTCPSNPARRHLCSICGNKGHGANVCNKNPNKNSPGPAQDSWGSGKGDQDWNSGKRGRRGKNKGKKY